MHSVSKVGHKYVHKYVHPFYKTYKKLFFKDGQQELFLILFFWLVWRHSQYVNDSITGFKEYKEKGNNRVVLMPLK